MTKSKNVIIFGSGAVTGIVLSKVIPKTTPVIFTKYIVEIIKAQVRLSKILKNEYWRIDEAITSETMFLNMIRPKIFFEVSFNVVDEDGQRRINTHFKSNKKES